MLLIILIKLHVFTGMGPWNLGGRAKFEIVEKGIHKCAERETEPPAASMFEFILKNYRLVILASLSENRKLAIHFFKQRFIKVCSKSRYLPPNLPSDAHVHM